jgi:hypothetical protein
MPTKVREERLYVAGKLVIASKDIYMAGEKTPLALREEPLVVEKGTVGLIMEASMHSSTADLTSTLTLQVQFLSGHTWWVSPHEIKPHIK